MYGYDDIDLTDFTPENISSYKKQIQTIVASLSIPAETYQSLYKSFINGEKTITEASFQSSITQKITKLLSLPVPLPLANQHLMLINSLSKINYLLSLSTTVEESIRYTALIAFQKNINQLAVSVENINSLISMQ